MKYSRGIYFIVLMGFVTLFSPYSTFSNTTEGENDPPAFMPISFTDIGIGATGVRLSHVSWGDYDGDGDLDAVILGSDGSTSYTKIYQNNGSGVFNDIFAGLIGVSDGTAEWGDYDGDNDLDLALTGSYTTKIYRNDGSGIFTEIGAGLAQLGFGSSIDWGDYDNDGYLDIALMGRDIDGLKISRIYRNDGSGTFTDIGANIINLEDGTIKWVDFENDGDLDLSMTGRNESDIAEAKLYINNGGAFLESSQEITGVIFGHMAWGDYDSDGDPDLGITGNDESDVPITKVYQNNSGNLTEISSGLPQVGQGSHLSWSDFDNDGDLDLALSGQGASNRFTAIYENVGGTFSNISAGLVGLYWGSLEWGDYDNDGDPDLLAAGEDVAGFVVTKLYRNESGTVNATPSIPQNPTTAVGLSSATLSWDAATDTETPGEAISYNLIIGTISGGMDIKAGHSDLSTGYRRIVSPGNVGQRTQWIAQGLPPGTYYWRVQAVDGGFQGGAFSVEQIFNIAEPFTNTGIALTGLEASHSSWADIENDGDLDFMLNGLNSSGVATTLMYQNSGTGTFTSLGANGILNLYDGEAAWSDYDKDGDVDLAITGHTGSSPVTRVYRNDGASTFTDIAGPFNAVSGGGIAWGDYDSDGDQDLAVTGSGSTIIYNNNFASFSDAGAGLPGLHNSDLAWGDYDNDGDLDLALMGENIDAFFYLFRNNNGSFTDVTGNIDPAFNGTVSWVDYDSDGDLDLSFNGTDGGTGLAKLYRNEGGTFIREHAGLEFLIDGHHTWGDVDNDGDLDLVILGDDINGTPASFLYENTGDTFLLASTNILGVGFKSYATFADIENDGDLDLLITGENSSGTPITQLYRNNKNTGNAVPGAPANLTDNVFGSKVNLQWTPPTGDETPSEALTYNIRVGTSPGAQDVMAPNSDLTTGQRRIVAKGNAQTGNSWTLRNLQSGATYYWSVQTLDNNYQAGSFATEGSFTVVEVLTNVAGLDQASRGEAAWGDFDADEDLDLAITGIDGAGNSFTSIFRNDSGSFVFAAGLGMGEDASLAWGDYDNDGDLDLAISGYDGVNIVADIYRNDNGSFNPISSGITPLFKGGITWGDYDNDGDLDLAMNGSDGSAYHLKIYNNSESGFQEIDHGHVGMAFGDLDWGDFDVDGDLDLAATGEDTNGSPFMMILANEGNDVFTDITGGDLFGVSHGSIDWGDFDNDSDLDLLATGSDGSGNLFSKVFRTDDATFIDIGANLMPLTESDAEWADVDNDGDLDITIQGSDFSQYYTKIYENTGGTFTEFGVSLPGIQVGSVAWGDYDSDGDLDLLLNGMDSFGNPQTSVYQSQLNPTSVFTENSLFTHSPLDGGLIRGSSSITLDFNSTLDPLSIAPNAIVINSSSSGSSGYTYSFHNDNESLNVNPVPGFGSNETVTVTIKTGQNGIKNLYGQWFDGNGDGLYTGVVDDEFSFSFDITTLADFSLNGTVDFDDLTFFQDAWLSEDLSKELGPVSGTFPALTVNPDGVFDIEDMITFIRYWNAQFTGSTTTANKVASNQISPSIRSLERLKTTAGSSKLKYVDFALREQPNPYQPSNGNTPKMVAYDISVNYPEVLSAMELIVEYDPGALRLRNIEKKKFFENIDGGQTLFLSHADSTNGVIIINTANFGTMGPAENHPLASLEFSVIGNNKPGDFNIGYDIRDQANNSEKAWSEIASEFGGDIPKAFVLEQNYPNPFNPQTTIRYQIAEKSKVRILVYNILGRKVATLLDKEVDPGFYRLQWNAAQHLASGLYLYVLDIKSGTGRDFRDVKKMLLIK